MTLSMLVECMYNYIYIYKILIKNTIRLMHVYITLNLYISIRITRVKERTGPADGLYKPA